MKRVRHGGLAGGEVVRDMQAVALVSGGKDSTFAIQQAIKLHGVEIACIAHIASRATAESTKPEAIEVDSFIYQSVGSEVVPFESIAFSKPLYIISNAPEAVDSSVQTPLEPEVWRLYRLLSRIILDFPGVKFVISGAIASNYQRVRIETVCRLLGLTSLAPLWYKSQTELLDAMTSSATELNAILVKVCSIGLSRKHLGKTIRQMRSHLLELHRRYGVHPCGEGGEYESFTLDSDCFPEYRIDLDFSSAVFVEHDPASEVSYLYFPPTAIYVAEKGTGVRREVSWETIPVSSSTSSQAAEFSWPLSPELAAPTVKAQKQAKISGSNTINSNHRLIFLEDNDAIDRAFYAATVRASDSLQIPPQSTIDRIIHLRVKAAAHGFFCAVAAVEGESAQSVLLTALSSLSDALRRSGADLQCVSYIALGISDIKHFGEFNAAYSRFWKHCADPPARACICVHPPRSSRDPVFVQVTCFGEVSHPSSCSLHIESVSGWAPACIGPYAQAHTLRNIEFIAGQIPLAPETMVLTHGPLPEQLRVCWNHSCEIAISRGCISQHGIVAEIFTGIIFLSAPTLTADLSQLALLGDIPIVQVAQLPRSAAVEIQLNMLRPSSPAGLSAVKPQDVIPQLSGSWEIKECWASREVRVPASGISLHQFLLLSSNNTACTALARTILSNQNTLLVEFFICSSSEENMLEVCSLSAAVFPTSISNVSTIFWQTKPVFALVSLWVASDIIDQSQEE